MASNTENYARCSVSGGFADPMGWSGSPLVRGLQFFSRVYTYEHSSKHWRYSA